MDLHVGRALSEAEIGALLAEARGRTLALLEPLSGEDLRAQHDPLMSPILWDLGHIGHFEDVWLTESLDGPLVGSEGLRGIYNPFENPRATRDELPLPTTEECLTYLSEVREGVLAKLSTLDLDKNTPLLKEGFVFRMVLQHEYQHNETVLQTLQLKRGEPYRPTRVAQAPERSGGTPRPGTMVRFPGGRVELGTDDRSVAYDNERPRHPIELAPFWIDVHPVTNQEYRAFVEDSGYDQENLWSHPGWAWRNEAELVAPMYWTRRDGVWHERGMDRCHELHPQRPVCHVSFWEAEAYARWAGKRLPSEAEWEAAASWDPESGRKLQYPWGDDPPRAEHANLDALLFETAPVGSYSAGVSPIGCWGMLGDVWEWTSSPLTGYPGFESFPYPEYSEVFFGDEYRVLRGGAWASRFGAVRNTFRNWDYPIRRQIFSGVRCARDG